MLTIISRHCCDNRHILTSSGSGSGSSGSMRIMRRRRRRLPSSLLWAATTMATAAFTTTCTINTQAVVTAFTTHESFTSPASTSSSSSSTSSSTSTSTSTLSLIDQYDAFILDQFGVMHNGKDALDGAKELIDLMISKNKKLIILSNTSSPSKTTLNRLENNLGFNSKDFLTAITSGEEACKYIKTKYGNESNDNNNNNNDVNKNKNKNKKKKFIWFTWDYPHNENVPNPMDFIDQLGGDSSNIEPTINIDEADFIVAHGTGVIRGSGNSDTSDTTTNNIISIGNFINDDTDWYKIDEILKECSKRNLPMICANPDYIVKYHDGTIKNMPGQIANRYITKFHMNNNNNKNETIIFGKPNPEHFSCCINEIYKNYNEENSQNQNYNSNNNKENSNNEPQQRKQKQQKQKHLRIAHVGDSISHDIAGANSVNGIDSIFIIGGIHSDDELLRVQVEVESKSAIEKNVNDNGENDNDNNNDNNVHVQSQSQSKSKLPSEKQLKEFFDNQGHTPTHVVPMFQI